MRNPTVIHPLARLNAKSGMIKFVHTDAKIHSFRSVVNDLTGDRLSYFDNNAPSINDELKRIKSIFKNIREKSLDIVECVGDF